MKLIVGLGNPGKQYQGTRHNVGYEVVDLLVQKWPGGSRREKFEAEVYEVQVGSDKLLLLKPLTFMNLSGKSVLAARDFYKVECESLLVVCDDFNLALGVLRFRAKGSAGGQKGLDDILRRLGADDVPRLRIGIGAPPPGREVTGHVLGRFSPEQQPEAKEAIQRAAEGAADWLSSGLTYCMNHYNAA